MLDTRCWIPVSSIIGQNGIDFVNTLFAVPTEEYLKELKQNAATIRLNKDLSYRGWYGIESSGKEEINKGITLLKKYLFST